MDLLGNFLHEWVVYVHMQGLVMYYKFSLIRWSMVAFGHNHVWKTMYFHENAIKLVYFALFTWLGNLNILCLKLLLPLNTLKHCYYMKSFVLDGSLLKTM